MQKSTLPFLLCSMFFLLLAGCVSYHPAKDYKSLATHGETFVNPYFANPQVDYVYKANISVYGNELTGIFIAKKINQTTHRVVFTTEFGNKLLDFEVSPTDFKVNSIVAELNRKILVNTLKKDFRLLLKTDFVITQVLQKEGNKIYQSADSKRTNYLFVTADGKLSDIVNASKTKEKIKISFTSENNIFAQNITIQHYDIKLRIALNYFKPD